MARQGFVVLGRNVRVGRLELDRVMRRGDLVVFVEVRSRRSAAVVEPYESIGPTKIANVRRAAAAWLATAGLGDVDVRFDAVSVVFDRDPPRIDHFEGAF